MYYIAALDLIYETYPFIKWIVIGCQIISLLMGL